MSGVDPRIGQEAKILGPGDIYEFVIRGWRLIAITAVVTCGGFVALSYVVTPSYRATAEILFSGPIEYIAPSELGGSDASDSSRYVESQIAVLRSTSILQKVVESLKLADDPQLVPMVVASLKEAVDVARVGLSDVVALSVTTDDPYSAKSITNAIADVYIRDRLESRQEGAKLVSAWLKERAELLRIELKRSEEAVEKFRVAHNLVATREGSLTDQQLSEMNLALINARADVATKRSKYQQAQKILHEGGNAQTIPDVLQSDVVSALRAQHAVVTRRKADLLSKYGERHPELLTVDAERRDIEAQIEAEIDRLIGNLRNEVETAEAREAALSRALALVSSQSEMEGQVGVQLRDLERIAATNKQLYETFLSRAKIAEEKATLFNSGVRVITYPSLPLSPSFPNRPLFAALGLIFGTFLGGVAALLQELLAPGFTAKRQVEEALAIPVLASVPRLTGRPGGPNVNGMPVDYLSHKPFSRFGEEIRRLRATLSLVTDPQRGTRVTLVTSAVVGEGKTTLALSLAHSAAADGERVILIDADLRRSTATAFFGMSDGVGLVDLLTLPIDPESAIHFDERSGVHLLPSGVRTLNPPALLGSSRMESVIEELKRGFDAVIIDAPPVGPVTDAAILARYVDKVIFAVKWRATSQEVVCEGIRHLGNRSKVAGIALTMVDELKLPRYGRYASIESNVSAEYYSNYIVS